jgi:hypothetical protein
VDHAALVVFVDGEALGAEGALEPAKDALASRKVMHGKTVWFMRRP